MKGFIYGVVSKNTGEVLDVTQTREVARKIKRDLDTQGWETTKVQIVQYAPVKVVR